MDFQVGWRIQKWHILAECIVSGLKQNEIFQK